jgi:hypothetical protein
MSRAWSRLLTVAAACTAPLAAGCGGSGTVPVKGTLTFDGKPLAGAFVTLIPDGPGGREAHGSTDAGGVFHLSTFSPKDGALPGAYKVTVTYSEPVPVPANLKSATDVQKAAAEAVDSRTTGLVIPPIYAQPDRTVLKHRVPEDGDLKLELRGTPR